MASPFTASSRRGNAWFCVGLVSSLPDIFDSGSASLSEHRSCAEQNSTPGCKVFYVPSDDSSQAHQIEGDSISHPEGGLRDQVLVFRYKGKVHAINNVSLITQILQLPRYASAAWTEDVVTNGVSSDVRILPIPSLKASRSTSRTLVLSWVLESLVRSMAGRLTCSRGEQIGPIINWEYGRFSYVPAPIRKLE